MIARRIALLRAAVAAALPLAVVAACTDAARGELEFEASWQPPSYDDVRDRVDLWADAIQPENDVAAKIEPLWPDRLRGDERLELLDRVAESFAAADDRAAALVRTCRADYEGPETPDASWLADPDVAPFLRNNLRLYYARWLAQYGLFDEVIEQLGGLAPADVVDPASLLFYRTVAFQQLVQPDDARAALVQLLEHRDKLPRRYQQVAQLLERDLASLDDESLDHIARRMNDIRRRLAYGRTGARVQEIERGVVESLDEKIEELEKKQQQQQSQSPAGGPQSSRPMEDSRLPSMQAPMQVEQRDIGHQSGWGDLPPREREQALQQIGRDFPAHYRDLIEQYFRELAAETNPPAN
jgi:hypothetical protein